MNEINFSKYLDKFLFEKGMKKIKVSEILGIKYNTFISKMKRDSFSYKEIIYLDVVLNLNFYENYKRKLKNDHRS